MAKQFILLDCDIDTNKKDTNKISGEYFFVGSQSEVEVELSSMLRDGWALDSLKVFEMGAECDFMARLVVPKEKK